jgi:hypothetical protein
MVSTISISFENSSLLQNPESMEQGAGVGQFWTPIQAIGGSLLHAGFQSYVNFTRHFLIL